MDSPNNGRWTSPVRKFSSLSICLIKCTDLNVHCQENVLLTLLQTLFLYIKVTEYLLYLGHFPFLESICSNLLADFPKTKQKINFIGGGFVTKKLSLKFLNKE